MALNERIDVPGRRLGRQKPSNRPALQLAGFLTGTIPAHPVAADNFAQVTDWGLYGNDKYGVCGPVSVANSLKLLTKDSGEPEFSVTLGDVFDLYRRSGNPQFDPTTDVDDNGVDMQTMLDALVRGGIGGRKPLAFAKVDVSNIDEVRAAISIFGCVLFGVDLEVAQQGQTDAGGPWDYTQTVDWGGHAIVAGRYTSSTGRHTTDISVITWAEVIGCTDAFLTKQLQEAWVVIWPEHVTHPAFQQGVDEAQLAADYLALTGRPFPTVTPPVPSPTPAPGPTPAPPGAAPFPGATPEVAARIVAVAARHHEDTTTWLNHHFANYFNTGEPDAGNEQQHTHALLHRILENTEIIMTTQADIDAIVTRLQSDEVGLQAAADETNAALTTIGTGVTAIEAEIAALQQQNPTIDLSALQAQVSTVGDGVTAATTAAANVAAAAAVVAAIPPAAA